MIQKRPAAHSAGRFFCRHYRHNSAKSALAPKNFGQELCRALTGLCRWCDPRPRALPWAGMSRPFRADSNIADPTDQLSV